MRPLSVNALIEAFAARLAAAELVFGHGTDSAADEAYRLVTDTLRGAPLTEHARRRLDAVLMRRTVDRVPLPYLTGTAWFGDLRLRMGRGVMIPRSPLGAVLAAGARPWLEREPERVLDLCCGCGALGIAAALRFPNATVDLADISAAALALSEDNARLAGVSDRTTVIESNLFAGLVDRSYDLILCNPPYVPSAELDAAAPEFQHEPRLGLDGGIDGLAVWRAIVADLPAHLGADGALLGEVGNLGRAFDRAFAHLGAIWLELDGAETQADGSSGVFVAAPALGDRIAAALAPAGD